MGVRFLLGGGSAREGGWSICAKSEMASLRAFGRAFVDT